MKTMQRSIVFTKAQMHWIIAEAKRLGVTISEIVRRIVDEKRENKND
jgi:hypothetical protein